MDLDGKVAIVTGAARMRGLGRAIAFKLAEDGAKVVVSGRHRSPESLPQHEQAAGWSGVDSVVAEINQNGGVALSSYADVVNPSEVQQLVEGTVDRLGRLDIMVNNAGLALVSGGKRVWEMDDQEWLQEIDVNLNGVFYCCRAAAQVLVRQGQGGAIINISSLAGSMIQPFMGGVHSGKAGREWPHTDACSGACALRGYRKRGLPWIFRH